MIMEMKHIFVEPPHFTCSTKFFSQDVPQADVSKHLETDENTALHIEAFVSSSGTLQSQYLVGDGCTISVTVEGGIMYAVLVLLEAYYVFDSRFPPQYAMMLSLLQMFVIEEPVKQETLQRFKFFAKKMRPVFNQTQVPVSAEQP
jgi:hypothetical protein